MKFRLLGDRLVQSLIWVLGFALAGCVPDDQTSIKPEHLLIANPKPLSKGGPQRFRENNEKHKILVAVFDTGIDYNHPYLMDHVHYDLSAKGQPIGAGLDFLAEGDVWASHRLVETSLYEFEFLSERQRKRAVDQYKASEEWDKYLRREKMGRICATEQLVKLDPRLQRFMSPYRDIAAERDRTQHGTHVAGLITYDNPAIGIIPYRVIPYHETEQDEADSARGKADKFVTNFETALEHAHARGVKIINLSLGGSFTKPTDTNDSSYEADLEKYENYKRLLTEGLNALVNRYSEMLFIAAAGNDSGWSDNESRLQYPCGLEATNMLCVGALNKDGTLAQFTNLPVNHVDLVMASGVKVISTIPSDNCEYLARQFRSFLTGGSNYTGLCTYEIKDKVWKPSTKFAERYQSLIDTFYDQCSREKELFNEMSGTSMATPIVSHVAAETWMENPGYSPADVIASLKSKATADSGRKLTTFKLKAKMPSWYNIFYDKASSEGNLPAIDQNLETGSTWLPKSGPTSDKVNARNHSTPSDWFEFAADVSRTVWKK